MAGKKDIEKMSHEEVEKEYNQAIVQRDAWSVRVKDLKRALDKHVDAERMGLDTTGLSPDEVEQLMSLLAKAKLPEGSVQAHVNVLIQNTEGVGV